MQTVSLDATLWFAGIVAQAAVVGLLLYKRVWRILPVFCAYCAWTLLSNAGAYGIHRFFPASYFTAYLVEMAVDSVLEFGVLVEVAWSVLRPFRASLPRGALMAVGALISGAGAVIWTFVYVPGLAGSLPQLRLLVQLQQTTSILRVLFFLVLAGCSQLFSIGWRDRELQVATGLGFYSLVSLAVEMLHTHQVLGPQYSHLNRIVIASYLCSLLYWVFSFTQEEAERREFTPQMQNFLLAMAGNAKTARVELTESAAAKRQKQGKL
jgi:hypothetical protein